MARAIFLPDASQDLLDIWHHIASQHEDLAAADRMLLDLRAAAERYASHPLLGQLCPDLDDHVRCFVVKSVVGLYLPVDDGIEVIQVIHGARDLTNRYRSRR